MINEITILIPTYNRAELLNKNLESIQNQDFKGRINCVISDNNSSDLTYEIYKKWQNRNKNIHIKYLKNDKDIPAIENFINTLLKSFIVFISHHNFIYIFIPALSFTFN